jgi:zinc protease
MNLFKQAGLALAIAATLGAIGLGGAAYSQTRTPAWPQATSDIPPDPAVVFGTLPNGMRYALQKNARPEHQVALRLRIEAGSDQEEPDQRGLAHMLEHMAFRGSTHFPEKAGEYEAIAAMQRLGLSFGADTNASTGWNQTTYMFDLPRSDAESIKTGLSLLRDVAGELSLSNASLDSERPIVLAEERARNTPTYNAQMANLQFLFRGEPMENSPIGKVEVIKTAPLARVRAYYEKYYRPERATLVVVGDIDPVALEAQIKALFGDWKGKGASPPDPHPPIKPRQPEFVVSTVADVTPQIALTWKTPYDLSPDTKAREKQRMIQALALQMFSQRLADATQTPNPPFLVAQTAHINLNQAAELTQLVMIPTSTGDWGKALDAAVSMKKQALTFGFQQPELDRIRSTVRTRLQNAVAGAGTRLSSNIASQIIDPTDRLRVYSAAATDLALFEESTKGLTLVDLNAALPKAFEGQGVLAQFIAPTEIAGGQAAFSARYAAAEAAPVTAMAAQTVKTWTHTRFGAPGKVVDRQEVADLGITFVRFANGVRAAIKPTRFTDNQILVQARFAGGRYAQPRDKVDASWVWGEGFTDGGLTDLTQVELAQVLAGHKIGMGVAITDNAFVLSGATRASDLDLQLQVLGAYVTAPGWRSTGLDQVKALLPNVVPNLLAQPGGIYALQGDILIHGGDQRWAPFPDARTLAAMTMEDAKARLTPVLANAPLEIVVVGDTTVDQAIEALSKTFGALPARKGTAPKNTQPVKFPAATAKPVVLTHAGRQDQGLFVIAWPTTDFWDDPKAAAPARILEMVLEQRVLDVLRSSQGKTYSPQGDSAFSYYFDNYGLITLRVEAQAADMPAIEASIRKIVQDLRTKPISADELARAKGPRIEYWRRTQATNTYWVGVLDDARKDAPLLAAARTSLPLTQAVTVESVQASANKWLNNDKAWRLEIVPKQAK